MECLGGGTRPCLVVGERWGTSIRGRWCEDASSPIMMSRYFLMPFSMKTTTTTNKNFKVCLSPMPTLLLSLWRGVGVGGGGGGGEGRRRGEVPISVGWKGLDLLTCNNLLFLIPQSNCIFFCGVDITVWKINCSLYITIWEMPSKAACLKILPLSLYLPAQVFKIKVWKINSLGLLYFASESLKIINIPFLVMY